MNYREWRERQASAEAKKKPVERESTEVIRKRVLVKCPPIRRGDMWKNLWLFPGSIVITGWKSLEEDGLPWPLVEVKYENDGVPKTGAVGLPAFMFAELVRASDGPAWGPEPKEAPTHEPRKVYLDQERK